MQAKNFSLANYLERINYKGTTQADAVTLKNLMRHQIFSIPFENLDVQAGKIVSLVHEEIVEKIIHRKRGGYCYEVNGLFAMALESIGIEYQLIAARPMFYPVKRPKTHMAIVAKVEGQSWLCDLGFGSYGIREPIRLDVLDCEIKQDCDVFKISKNTEHDFLLQALVEDEWANQYEFNLCPQEWIDFAPANYLNSKHPDSVFVQKNLVVLLNPNGRDILFGDSLKTVRNGQTTKSIVAPEELTSVLRERFNLILDN